MQRQQEQEIRPGNFVGRRQGPPFVCEYCGLGGFPTLSALHGHRRSHVDLVREDRSFSTEEALMFMARRFGGVINVPDSYRRNLDKQLGITEEDRHHNGGPNIDLNMPPPPA